MRAHGGFVKRISGTESDDDFKAYILPNVSKIDFVRLSIINTPMNEDVSVTGSDNKLKFKLENKVVVYELCKSSIVDIENETPDNDKMLSTENLLNGAVTPVEPSAPVTVPELVNENQVTKTEGVNEAIPVNNSVSNGNVTEGNNEPEVTAPESVSTPVAEENAEPKPETPTNTEPAPVEVNQTAPRNEEENKPKEGIIEKALRTINNGLNNFTPFGGKNNKAEPVTEPVKSPVASPVVEPVKSPVASPDDSVTTETAKLLKIKPTETVLPEQLKQPVNSEVMEQLEQVGQVNIMNKAETVVPNATPVEPNATPVEPNATPVEPNATPVEPTSINTPEPLLTPTEQNPEPVAPTPEPSLTPVVEPEVSQIVSTPVSTPELQSLNSSKNQSPLVSSNNSKGSLLVGGKSKKRRYTRGSHSRRIKTI
jgi:hypothetical protein